MKRFVKTLTVLCVAAFALTAVAAASASASTFKANELGTLSGSATSNQVFKTGAGTVTCTKASTSGEVTAEEATEQEVSVSYSGCTAFGFVSVTISTAEYTLHANGGVDIDNTITINVPLAGCHVTVGPQELGTVSYENVSGEIEQSSAVTGIVSTGSGGICGGSNTTGSYTGSNLVKLNGGEGSVEWVE